MSKPPSHNLPDHQLVDALNAGDIAAFDALYYRYRDWVARLARRFTGNDADALDVMQEVFAYLHRKFPGFELTAAMTTFLYPVVRNLSIGARRKRARFHGGADHLDSIIAPPEPKPADASRAELAAVMQLLPDDQRETLLMRIVDGFSMQEIAQALEIPVGTVKSRLHNALASLRTDPRTTRYFDKPPDPSG